MAAKYTEIVRELSQQIATMKRGEQLPTELALSEEFDVSPMTVRRALGILADSGRIIAVRGRGTFVLRPGVTNRMEMISFSQAVRSAGMAPSARVLSASTDEGTAQEIDELEIEPGSMVYRFERLRYADDRPICIDSHLLSAERFPDLLRMDLTRSLHEILTSQFNSFAASLESRIAAELPDGREAAFLEVTEATPCLRVHSRRRSPDGAIEQVASSLYRGDLWEIVTDQQF